MKKNSKTVIVRDFNTPHSTIDRSSWQKIRTKLLGLDTLHQVDLTDIYRTFHVRKAEHTFFWKAHGILSKIDHNVLKLAINYRKKTGKLTNIWRLQNMFPNTQYIKEEIKREKNTWDKWKCKQHNSTNKMKQKPS